MSGATMLRVEDVSVRYGGAVLALDGVSFDVPTGGSVALLGANGAGKTTVLRAVSGLLQYHNGCTTRGTITYLGRSIIGADPARLVAGGIAQVLEGRRIFRDLTVAENLRAGAFSARDRGRENAVREHVLELFPILGQRLQQAAGFLSGGEQSMLAIGRALMAQPRLLLLDEPSLGLAPLVVQQIGHTLQRINAESETTLLVVDQSTALALSTTQHAYLLETGRIVNSGRTAELLADKSVRAAYLGTEAGSEKVEQLVSEATSS